MKFAGIHIFLGLTLGLLTTPAWAQMTGATARLDSTSLLIGNQTRMELTVTVPAGSTLNWPLFTDTLTANLEILRKSAPDTVSSNPESYTIRQQLLITSFDSGYFVIPPIRFTYHRKDDTVSYFTETGPLRLTVSTVSTDQTKDIKPIKPPLTAPVTLKEILTWAGLGLLAAALVSGAYYYFSRKRKKQPVIRMRLKPTIPPDEAAIEALEALRLKKLWQSGKVKEYYSEMTEIVREYIELRFPVRALEMTTDEISSAMRQTEANREAQQKLNSTLVLADLVKFAKEQPLPAENDLCLHHCIDFVKETRPMKTSGSGTGPTDDNKPPKPVS